MPNWVFNRLVVTGPALERAAFRTRVSGSPAVMVPGSTSDEIDSAGIPLRLGQTVPVPVPVRFGRDTDAGYRFRLAEWGVKQMKTKWVNSTLPLNMDIS